MQHPLPAEEYQMKHLKEAVDTISILKTMQTQVELDSCRAK